MDAELKLKPEETVRVYADISKDAERKLRLRCMTQETVEGRRITRKEYLEKLISDDVAKVAGASIREVSTRRAR